MRCYWSVVYFFAECISLVGAAAIGSSTYWVRMEYKIELFMWVQTFVQDGQPLQFVLVKRLFIQHAAEDRPHPSAGDSTRLFPSHGLRLLAGSVGSAGCCSRGRTSTTANTKTP